MRVDVDYLISLMNEFTFNGKGVDNSELGEQDGDTSAGPSSYPTVTKWVTGLKRGPANQIGNTKWKDSYTITRGKSNTLL